MRAVVFSTKPFDREYLSAAAAAAENPRIELTFLEHRLTEDTAALAADHDAVIAFVNDSLTRETLALLAAGGARIVALRSAGFNNVDLAAAAELGLTVARVPAYSPHAVAEHTIALMLCLNRKIHRAYNRVREGNFALSGLLGFDMHGRTAGIVGTGQIGCVVAQILRGMGCRLLATDPRPSRECLALGVEYVELPSLLAQSDIVTLHCPLTPQTRHMIDAAALDRMKPGAMLINTGRGALIDTPAAIAALKSRKLGSLGLDVYEEEAGVFFEDLSGQVINDDVLMRLMTFPNVLITSHQGFFTDDALREIARTTVSNIVNFYHGRPTNLCPAP